MSDLLIIQLFVMGAVFWRAAHEKLAWDRAGFVMLGCSCALMALRRASAPMDDFLKSGQVILPLAISWILAASASCFAIEMFVRLKNKPEAHRHPDYAGPKRYFWPFLWFFLIAGLDFAPAQWNGQNSIYLEASEARKYALQGPNRLAAIEQVRYETARNLDVLLLVSTEATVEGANARRKLELLLQRLETLQCPPSLSPTAVPELLPTSPQSR